MNRQIYIQYIIDQLSILAMKIAVSGKLNMHDLNLHSENFYQNFFNELFQWKLINLNSIKLNAEAIDLVDEENRILIQVSSTATKQKIESALSKDLSSYDGYTFKFISISKDADELRRKEYHNPSKVIFTPMNDIYDVPSLMRIINTLEINALKRIYELIKEELGAEISSQKIESNLATIINLLSKEDWDQVRSDIQTDPYELDRKIEHNKLVSAKNIVEDYKIHYSRVDNIYSEFNLQGVNKSTSVLDSIRHHYLSNQQSFHNDDLFFKIIASVIDRIQNSTNYVTIPYDELELCVSILVVDAFMRCKIFENPEGYTLVTS